jgi:hypothetical protein
MTLPIDRLSDHHKSMLLRIALDAGLDLSDENLPKIRGIILRDRLYIDFSRNGRDLDEIYCFIADYQSRERV